MTARRIIKIDVISDFLCPWSFIGHNALERSIAQIRAAGLPVDFSIRYHPFFLANALYLNDDEPVSTLEFFERKLGPEKCKTIVDLVVSRAAQEGLNFKFGGKVRQTTRAHRLMLRAYRTSGQAVHLALLRNLFRTFFEEEQDIGDEDTLAEISCSPDVMLFPTVNDAREWILGDELSNEVRTLSADAQRKGVTGVPFAVIDGRWAVTGCQKPECFFKIFEKLANTELHETPSLPCPTAASTQKPEASCSTEFATISL